MKQLAPVRLLRTLLIPTGQRNNNSTNMTVQSEMNSITNASSSNEIKVDAEDKRVVSLSENIKNNKPSKYNSSLNTDNTTDATSKCQHSGDAAVEASSKGIHPVWQKLQLMTHDTVWNINIGLLLVLFLASLLLLIYLWKRNISKINESIQSKGGKPIKVLTISGGIVSAVSDTTAQEKVEMVCRTFDDVHDQGLVRFTNPVE